jgi:formylglycine-generating enzyme required for sulfatase activity
MKKIISFVLLFLTACVNPTIIPTSTSTLAMPTPSLTLAPTIRPPSTVTLTATPDANEFIDKKGISMRLIPAGEFTMGNDFLSTGSMPAHKVTLNAYYIDKFEVTNALYETCASMGVCKPPHSIGSYTRDNYYGNAQFNNYPVVNIDWYMAKMFCEWRDARLPTEAEWEKAARGGNNENSYPWNTSDCIILHDEKAKEGCKGEGGIDTYEVGTYENNKSSYGVYDMPSNAWEWVSSLYLPYPYNANDGRENSNSPDARVHRSGWRNWGMPFASMPQIGFRCAISVPK